MAKRKEKGILWLLTAILCQITALCLELFTKGAVLALARPHNGKDCYAYSYFSHYPYGYAFFSPMVTGILTVLLLLLSSLVIIFRKSKRNYKNAFGCNIAAVVTALLVLLPHHKSINWISISIALLLAVSCICFIGLRKSYLKDTV